MHDAKAVCEGAGGKVKPDEWNGPELAGLGPGFDCSIEPIKYDDNASSMLAFCGGDQLCEVTFIILTDKARRQADLYAVDARIQGKYGPPTYSDGADMVNWIANCSANRRSDGYHFWKFAHLAGSINLDYLCFAAESDPTDDSSPIRLRYDDVRGRHARAVETHRRNENY